MLLWIHHRVAWWRDVMAGISVHGCGVCSEWCYVCKGRNLLMHRVGVGRMLCRVWCRVREQQLLEWHGARQRARGVLCSSQPEGLAIRWWRDMLGSE